MKKWFVVVVVLMLAVFAVSTALAETVVLKDKGAQAGCWIKDAPNKNAKNLVVFAQGQEGQVFAEYGDYYAATAGDKVGYIWSKATFSTNGVTRVTGLGARMVDTPSKAGKTVGFIKAGTLLFPAALIVTWRQIQAGPVVGWVCAEYVEAKK